MRFSILAVTFGLTLAAMMTSATEAQEALKPVQHWGGLIKESGKRALAPKSKVSGVGYLTNQDAFEKLFDAWGLKEKPPKIDFKKQIVFVQTSDGPNLPKAFYTLDAAGKLTAAFKQTEKGGPGFGYSIDVLDRTGIKSYQGKPLE
jgi:hypothetical protein